jgi:hypothetical protein
VIDNNIGLEELTGHLENVEKDSLRHEDGTLRSSNGKDDDGDKAQLQLLIEVTEGLLSQT